MYRLRHCKDCIGCGWKSPVRIPQSTSKISYLDSARWWLSSYILQTINPVLLDVGCNATNTKEGSIYHNKLLSALTLKPFLRKAFYLRHTADESAQELKYNTVVGDNDWYVNLTRHICRALARYKKINGTEVTIDVVKVVSS